MAVRALIARFVLKQTALNDLLDCNPVNLRLCECLRGAANMSMVGGVYEVCGRVVCKVGCKGCVIPIATFEMRSVGFLY